MGNQRILAIDFGDARIGLAISDPLNLFAQPLCTIENTGKQCIKEILELVQAHQVLELVIGMPYELDGSIGPQGKKVQRFTRRLEARAQASQTDIRVTFIDERLTTAEAERVIAGSGLQNRERSAALDRISAALLLETYINSRAN